MGVGGDAGGGMNNNFMGSGRSKDSKDYLKKPVFVNLGGDPDPL